MNSVNDNNQNLIPIVGYGTFITKFRWINDPNVEVCIVKGYIRILPEGNWFPYALPLKDHSFKALRFFVDENKLKELDNYEGVSTNLFKRKEININLPNNPHSKAFIYTPTDETVERLKLSPKIDENDRWKDEMKKVPELKAKFPELFS